MGTNFYWHPPVDDTDPIHVGKRYSAGGGNVSWILHAPIVLDKRITSWRQWRQVLIRLGGKVMDEYGGHHDIARFIEQVDTTPIEVRDRQHRLYPDPLGRSWVDEDGFSFSAYEFS